MTPIVIPPSSLAKRWNQNQQATTTTRTSTRRVVIKKKQHENDLSMSSSPSMPMLDTCHLPWTTTGAVYQSHWDWQMRYFHDQLTNLRVKNQDQDQPNVDDLLHMISDDGKDRIYTVALESDEYRDIRMTYLHCDDGATQIFRCACYPRSNGSFSSSNSDSEDPLPVLGMGFMRFAGGRRNVAIMDYQPLNNNDDKGHSRPADKLYQSQLNKIRSQYPDFQQSMSDKHFNADEKQLYWTESPLIAKWNVVDTNDDSHNGGGGNDEWEQLTSSHQRVVAAHVQTTKRLVAEKQDQHHRDDVAVKDLHAEYDTFLSAREPAGHLLTRAFGPDVADRIVHQVLFPLSR
jgi:Ferredoxin-dependent bilin reductase